MSNIDTWLFHLLNNLAGKSSGADWVILFFAQYLAFILIAVFLVYIFRTIHPNRKRLMAIILVLSAIGLSRFVVTSLIRALYHRIRPWIALHIHNLISVQSYSFPSGHAAFFFAFSTIVYFHNKKLGFFFFLSSLLMGLARVAAGVHYPSDVLGGAVVGIASGIAIIKIRKLISI